jgi:hypothetical protein
MLRMTFRRGAAIGASAVLFGLCSGTVTAQTAVPDFSGSWQRAGDFPSTYDPPVSGPGPIVDPQPRGADDALPWLGDHTNPILKPHAADVVKKRTEFLKAGGEDLPAYSLCWPSGVPQAINLREPVQFLQEKHMITILYQRDHQVRRIYLDTQHTANPKHSWYGESIGHYEGDDTLVVDTIAQNDKTNVDKFGTPHSDKIHVIERYTMAPDRRTMTVSFTVEDPETFTTVWGARATYRRGNAIPTEIICAENNKNASTGQNYPIPTSAKDDF